MGDSRKNKKTIKAFFKLIMVFCGAFRSGGYWETRPPLACQ
jgi:hypothetical protein